MSKFESSEIGSVSVKIGVTAEPSDEFSDVAHALGFVRVVPCSDCAYRGTHDCPAKDSVECMAFCSRGRERETMTRDERIEIAEQLRKSNGIMKFVDALGMGMDSNWYWTDVSKRVADLIDPTCEMDDAGDVPASVKDNLNTFFCSECGAPVYNDMSPSYCPYCGARVVSGDGE